MDAFNDILGAVGGVVWGPVMLVLLLGTGLFLTIGLKFMTIRRLGYAFVQMWKGRAGEGDGQISPFNALMTAMAATVGTGNIAGVATAIFLGGPGAVFWMWMTALLGMATKYGEAVLAVKYREVDELGNYVGGPMYYIRNGLGEKWKWLAFLFALFGTIAAFGIGNTIQANSVAQAAKANFGVPEVATGVVLAALTFLVIFGGVKVLAEVAGKLVPFMAVVYFVGAFAIIITNIEMLPAALATIVSDAFTGTAATGGFAGSTIWLAIRFGVARGVFSNEAGLGTAPIAHAAAKTNDPVRQGTIGMLGTFIDTIIICSMTALVIVMTGAWDSGKTGAELSTHAFELGLPGFGSYVVTFGLIVFAFTTILGWSLYGERCAEYLFGTKIIWPYRVLWVIAVPIGAMASLTTLWNLADVLNGLMALPNLIALLLLSPVIFKITKDYFANK
ncbi:sodium:alanine symporter family protein [Magnetospira sp. QH-2]|uniref:alanine/glycine:cation symporter family protein n=1 Tax=Magnetospira sp. (strain QH-2) TaxID=1288970 RepID=UPI0003E80FB8|nr:sodium:alanine symporter family protein [Magnetospira sp. QH-2]CCQ73685.1 Sodium:alanine symporter [Magnetospira sp. QH-2]